MGVFPKLSLWLKLWAIMFERCTGTPLFLVVLQTNKKKPPLPYSLCSSFPPRRSRHFPLMCFSPYVLNIKRVELRGAEHFQAASALWGGWQNSQMGPTRLMHPGRQDKSTPPPSNPPVIAVSSQQPAETYIRLHLYSFSTTFWPLTHLQQLQNVAKLPAVQ